MNTVDTKGIKNSYLFPLLLSCLFPINIISLVTHPMDSVYDMLVTAVCLVSCYLNVFEFFLRGLTLNGELLKISSLPSIFPEYVFFFILWHLFSLYSTLVKKPTDFCFKYLIMCNQNPSEPKVLPLLIPITADKVFFFCRGLIRQVYMKFLENDWGLLYCYNVYILYFITTAEKLVSCLEWDHIHLCEFLNVGYSNLFVLAPNLFNFLVRIILNCILGIFLFHLLKSY